MITGLTLTILLFVVVILFYGLHFWLIRKYDPFREKGSSGDLGYTLMGLAVSILLIIQPAVWPGLGLYTEAAWGLLLQLVGLLLFISSLYLHWWARSNLRQFFGERIEVQKDQHLIETGPYAYIRHPIYTSFFIFSFGLLLLNPALPILLVVLYTFWDYGRLVNAEEKMLGDNVPGYKEYIQRTSRFFPVPGKRSKGQP